MPIFHVELRSEGEPPPGLARTLANAFGPLFESPPGHVWVRVSSCPPERYAENGEGEVPDWVFVRVILRALPPEDALAARVREITRIVAEASARSPDDVHVYFDPPAAGRIAFGGELVRSSG